MRVYMEGMKPSSPILIYQMGKVGSLTLYNTLKKLHLAHPVYHVHFLNAEQIELMNRHLASLPDTAPFQEHSIASKYLRRRLDKNLDTEYIIMCLVREPIARYVSEFFELIWMYHPELLDKNGDVRAEETLQVLIQQLLCVSQPTDLTYNWFDRELKTVFGIDVYEFPFDRKSGYSLINLHNIRLLLLRLEDLDHNTDVLVQFLGLSKPLKLIKANTAQSKGYKDQYQYILENLVIPDRVCSLVYASRLATHFYTEEMIENFFRKWTKHTG